MWARRFLGLVLVGSINCEQPQDILLRKASGAAAGRAASFETLTPEAGEPTLPTVDMMRSWVVGLDSELDVQLETMPTTRSSSVFSQTNEDYEILQEIQRVMATQEGRNRANVLVDEDPDFFVFNQNVATAMEGTCEYLRSHETLISAETIACVCGETDDTSVACAAIFQQEILNIDESEDEETRNLLSAERQAQTVRCTFAAQGEASLDMFINELSKSNLEGSLCLGAQCGVSIFALPLEAVITVTACIPLNIPDPLDREAAEDLARIELEAEICLLAVKDLPRSIQKTLKALGLYCFISFTGRVQPYLGLFTGTVSASLYGISVKGSLAYLFSDGLRNENKVCDGITECSGFEKNTDCGLCNQDFTADIVVGDKIFFIIPGPAIQIGTFNEIEDCAVSGANDQCDSGIETRKANATELCSSNDDCVNNACGRNGDGISQSSFCCESGQTIDLSGTAFCTGQLDGSHCSTDGQCASLYCKQTGGLFDNGVCTSLARVGFECSLSQDCFNGVCGCRSHDNCDTKVCCPNGMSEGCCLEVQNLRRGEFCLDNDNCRNGVCAAGKNDGDSICCPSGSSTYSLFKGWRVCD